MKTRLALATVAAALVAAAPAAAHDAYPCGKPFRADWSSKPVQTCDLSNPYAHDRIPVYRAPVAHAKSAAVPAAYGYLQGTSGQSFVCQRRFAAAEYYHPKGWRNVWWAYTKSDDHKWGWVPEVFFRGGNNDEADGGLRVCSSGDPGAPAPAPAPKPTSNCQTYYVIGIRGSGQSMSGDMEMGSPVGQTARTAVEKLQADSAITTVTAYSLPYPAAPVSSIFAWQHGKNVFGASLVKGVRMLSARIRQLVARCPQTRIAVIGFSQGAGVASRTMRALRASVLSHIRMVALYADPYSIGNSDYSLSYNYFSRKFARKRLGSGILKNYRLPAALPHKLDICFYQDPICSWPDNALYQYWVAKKFKVHSHYGDFKPLDGERLVTSIGRIVALELEG